MPVIEVKFPATVQRARRAPALLLAASMLWGSAVAAADVRPEAAPLPEPAANAALASTPDDLRLLDARDAWRRGPITGS
jgi:hypothetical protein